ncbi:hypothetical protein Q3G72_012752 [Acer saccharum]|nr:hypothetical protein Q3G72_012752 [Acer saccharum]
MRTEVPKCQGNLQPEEFLEWLGVVEEILEFKNVPNNSKVALVATRLRGRAAAWWQQMKLTRNHSGKAKISDWEKIKRKMRAEFLPHNFQRYYGKLRQQILDVVNLFDLTSVSEAHQRALQVEKTTTRRMGGGPFSSNSVGSIGRTGASSSNFGWQQRTVANSSGGAPRPVTNQAQPTPNQL